MRFRSPVSVLLLFALVAASAQPAHAAPTQLSETQVVASAVPAAATCDIYPLALPAEVVTTATRGTTIPAINLGSDSGNFGFVTWTGDNSAGALAGSLTAPGDADTYVSAADPEDTQVDIGDWVQGVPGAKNSKAVRTAMNDLYGRDIVVPTYAETRGTGSNLEYRVASFEVIRILDYHWKGDKWISIDHVGTTTCYGSPPVANDVTVTTTANEPVRLPLSGVDPDGEGVSLSISTAPSHGTVTSPFSDFTYSPDADFVGTDYFYYVARDGSSESSPAIGIVVVSEPNSAPNVVSQPTQSGVLGAGYQYAVEAQDPDGDVLRYSLEDTSGTFAIGRDSGVVKGVLRDSTAVESVSGANTNCLAYTYDAGAIDLKQVWWWKTNLNGMGINVTGPPIVGRMYDVNGDGVIDTNDPPIVVFASGGASAQRLIALNGATGEQLWVNTDRNFAGAAQAAGDLDGDGDWEIVKLLRDHRQTLVALDHLGNILWEAPTGPYASSPNASDNMAIADLDGDGRRKSSTATASSAIPANSSGRAVLRPAVTLRMEFRRPPSISTTTAARRWSLAWPSTTPTALRALATRQLSTATASRPWRTSTATALPRSSSLELASSHARSQHDRDLEAQPSGHEGRRVACHRGCGRGRNP